MNKEQMVKTDEFKELVKQFMIEELKIGDKIKLEGYDEAWIGWVTNSSYLIHKIKNRFDENGKISRGWLLKNLEVCWVTKLDWHSKN